MLLYPANDNNKTIIERDDEYYWFTIPVTFIETSRCAFRSAVERSSTFYKRSTIAGSFFSRLTIYNNILVLYGPLKQQSRSAMTNRLKQWLQHELFLASNKDERTAGLKQTWKVQFGRSLFSPTCDFSARPDWIFCRNRRACQRSIFTYIVTARSRSSNWCLALNSFTG